MQARFSLPANYWNISGRFPRLACTKKEITLWTTWPISSIDFLLVFI
ncbi:hypothetical protein LINPERHAP1_LOCUS30755 [Linum perenne]